MGTQPALLEIKDISVSYGAEPVIHDISFNVEAGECFGLMGLNGAGKTTLIKAILGLRDQDKGTITILGKPSTQAESKAQLAFLPERFDPPWFLTGIEFLKFSLSLYRQPFDKDHIIQSAQKLALEEKVLYRRVQTYSKGMRQKLGLLGTLLTNCPLLILDEPMSGLDPLARSLVKDMLAEARKKGRTIFFSSHILADMDEICNRVALLDNAVIKFLGTPSALKQQTSCENLERAFLESIEKRPAA